MQTEIIADLFIKTLKNYSGFSKKDELSCKDLLDAIAPLVYEQGNQYLKRIPISMEDLLKQVNLFLNNKLKQLPNSPLLQTLSQFFSTYRAYVFNLHYGVQNKLELEDFCSKRVLEIEADLSWSLNDLTHERDKKTLLQHFFKLIEHELSIKRNMFLCYCLSSLLQNHIPEEKLNAYFGCLLTMVDVKDVLLEVEVFNEYKSEHLFGALAMLIPLIDAQKKSVAIDKLIAFFQEYLPEYCQKVTILFNKGPASVLLMLKENMNQEQKSLVIDIALDYVEQAHSSLAIEWLASFKESFTEAHYEKIKRILSKVNEDKNNLFEPLKLKLLSMLPSEGQQQEGRKAIYEQALFCRLRTWIVQRKRADLYHSALASLDLLSIEHQQRILAALIQNWRELPRQVALLESAFVCSYISKDALKDVVVNIYTPEERQQKEEDLKESSKSMPANTIPLEASWGEEAWEEFLRYLNYSSFDSFDEHYREALKALSYSTAIPQKIIPQVLDFLVRGTQKMVRFERDVGFGYRYQEDNKNVMYANEALWSWVDKLSLDETAYLLEKLCSKQYSLSNEIRVLALYAHAHHQKELQVLEQSPKANGLKNPEHHFEATHETTKAATAIQCFFRQRKAQRQLRELKQEKVEGLERWHDYKHFIVELKLMAAQMNAAMQDGNLAVFCQLSQNFHEMHRRAESYLRYPALTEVDKVRYQVL